jgi:hypothetical protein
LPLPSFDQVPPGHYQGLAWSHRGDAVTVALSAPP